MNHVRLSLVALSVCLPGMAGCLIMHHNTKYVREAEQQKHVVFQSEAAERVFKARAMNDDVRNAEGRSNVVAIPFLVLWSTTRVKAQPAFYNDQILACDTNGDRQITESEAFTYNPTYGTSTENVAKDSTEPPFASPGKPAMTSSAPRSSAPTSGTRPTVRNGAGAPIKQVSGSQPN